ncbi:beta strand repeat-containing protein [Flavobacterium marginilacus]|uniref:beta strand repeat-containing protein n=1 Tax=Flavobacterium marginilacus TaxID=3003256 RepID=UPI0032C44AF7
MSGSYNGTKSYTVNGFAIAGSTAVFNAPGTYVLGVKDDNGCEAFVNYTIEKQLLAVASLTKDLYCTAPVNAVINVTITDGVAPYSYQMYNGASAVGSLVTGVSGPGFTASAAAAGTYHFVITDANGASCTVTTNTVEVTDPSLAPPAFTTAQTNVSCAGSSDASIRVTPSSGTAPYAFALAGTGANHTGDTTGIYTGLQAGSYTITVTDAKGCTSGVTAAVVITEPVVLTATATASVNTTCSTAAVITVTGHDGTQTGTGTGYYYSFDNGVTYDVSDTFTVNDNGTIQTIMYAVKDANGCTTAPQPIVVNPLNKPTDLAFAVTTAPTCAAPASTVTLTASNGVGTLQYETIAPSAMIIGKQTSAVFAGLTAGDYTFQVTDANGCTYQEVYTVKAVTPIVIAGSVAVNVSCNALNGTDNNGSASFTVTGFSAAGNYTVAVSPALLASQITSSGDVITLTGLTAGTYTVTVTDNTTGCSDSDAVMLAAPAAITFTANASKVYCSQDITQITVSAVTGGTGVYTYAAVKAGLPAPLAGAYSTNAVLSADTDLADLSWDVYVKDANGCISAKVTVPVTFDAAPSITAPAGQCFAGTPLTADLSLVSGSYNGTKSYTVNGFAIAGSTAVFNAPGTYVLGVKDDNGCEAFVNYTIEKQLLAVASLTKDLYCTAPVNAVINVTITDGVAPYSYQMYNGASAVGSLVTGVSGPGFTASAAAAGTYHFVITDANGASCTVTTNTVEVTDPSLAPPAFTTAQTNVSCAGSSDASIRVTPSSGTAPYAFALAGTGANHTGDTTGIYTGLQAGSYTITVTDAKGCTSGVTAAVVITEPVVLTATATASVNTTCSTAAVITVTGHDGTQTGTGTGYYYSFDNGVTYDVSDTFTVNDNGTIQTIMYAVKDANGCTTAPQPIVVNPLNKPTDLAFAVTTAPTCAAPASTVTLTASNGVGTLQYETIAPSAMIIGKQTSAVFAGLTAGDYTFQVTDANGCTYQEVYTVKAVTPIVIAGSVAVNVSCNALNGTDNNGSASFTVTGFSAAGNYTVAVSPALLASQITSSGDVITLTGLTAGTYTVTVTDNTTGCSDSDAVMLAAPAAITFTANASKVYCSQDITQITVSAVTGGTGVYTYAAVKAGTFQCHWQELTALTLYFLQILILQIYHGMFM